MTTVPNFISIGCECGGPEASIIGDIKVALFHALLRHVTSSHCEAVDEYGLVLRVDGSLQKYGEEGLSRLRFAKSRRYITIDIQIPEVVWQPMNKQQLKAYLVCQVKAAVVACINRLQKEKYDVASEELMAEVEAASNEYLATDH